MASDAAVSDRRSIRRALARLLPIGLVLVLLAACVPAPPFPMPSLYEGGFSGGLYKQVDPERCAGVQIDVQIGADLAIVDQPTGASLGTDRTQFELGYCQPDPEQSDVDVTGAMRLLCCTSDTGEPGSDELSGPARVRRRGSTVTVDLDIEQATGRYLGAYGTCTVTGDVYYYGWPEPPPPAYLNFFGSIDCRIGGPDGPPPPPNLYLRTYQAPDAVRGLPYRLELQASGGTPPYRWRATGLPRGLRLRDGVIVGQSRDPGEATVELRLRDAAGAVRTGSLTIFTQDPDVAGTIRAIDTEGTRLWSGFETSVSDDGRMVAFTSSDAGLTEPPGVLDTSDVFTWDRSANVIRRLTHDVRADHESVEVSGDGGTVVFVSNAAGLVPADPTPDRDVFLVAADGGPLTLVTTDDGQGGLGASVSDDGTKVAYAAGGELFIWDRATGQSTVVTEDQETFFSLDLSDDGSQVLFASLDGGGGVDLSVADTATGALTDIDIDSEGFGGASLSGDGTTVAITSETTGLVPPGRTDTNDGADLFRADVATGAVVRITNGDAPSNGEPVISDDGTIIAFSSLATDIAARERDEDTVDDLFVWNAETDLVSRLSRSPSRGHASPLGDLDVSGDGRTIVFSGPVQDLDPNAAPVTGTLWWLYVWGRAR